jgi:hypothetical protein
MRGLKPRIVGGDAEATGIMIGERAADLTREDADSLRGS